MVYCSFIEWGKPGYPKDTQVLSIDKAASDPRLRMVKSTKHFMVLHSNINPDLKYHHALLDFDGRFMDIPYEEMCDRLRAYELTGHLYKTLHGWHFYSNTLHHISEIAEISRALGGCPGQRELGLQRGYFSLRTGMKPDREPDIYYIGSLSGDHEEKSLIARYHDYYDSYYRTLYYSKFVPKLDSGIDYIPF